MKKMTVSLVAVFTALLLASPIFAADTSMKSGMSGSKSSSASAMQKSKLRSANEIIDMDVVSKKGEEIGQIKDIKFDLQTGRIGYLTLSREGFMGMEKSEIAVPLEAIHFSPNADQATLAVDKSKLDNVPKQANMSDEEFRRQLQSHYGVSPAWKGSQSSGSQQLMPSQQKKTPSQEKSTY